MRCAVSEGLCDLIIYPMASDWEPDMGLERRGKVMWGTRIESDKEQIIWRQNGRCYKCHCNLMSLDEMLPYVTMNRSGYSDLHAVCKPCWEKTNKCVIETTTEKFWRNMSPEDIAEHDKQYTEATDEEVRKKL